MDRQLLRPLGIGGILDAGFQLYRQSYQVVIPVSLIFFGPYYLLQRLLLYKELGRIPALARKGNLQSIIDQYTHAGAQPDQLSTALPAHFFSMAAVLLILLPLFFIVVLPLAVSAMLNVTKALRNGEQPRLSIVLKQAFRRFWPIVGSTMLVAVLFLGFYFMVFFILGILGGLMVAVGIGMTASLGNQAAAAVFAIVLAAAAILGMLGVYCYFVTRFIFYLPFAALENKTPGIGYSWVLTRRNFWRLFGLGCIVLLMYDMLALGMDVLFFLHVSIFFQVLEVLFMIVIAPIVVLPYTVAFFDLKVRGEGLDLLEAIQSMKKEAADEQVY